MNVYAPKTLERNSVVVMYRDGRWHVRVVDNAEVNERDFALEAHAHSFAQGQRLRLGLINSLL